MGSVRKAEQCHWLGGDHAMIAFDQRLIVHRVVYLLSSRYTKKKKTQEVCSQSVQGPTLNGGLPLGGGGGGVGGLGSSGAAASAASPDVKQVLLSGLLQPDAFVWHRKCS